ncbi:MAG: ParB N-terminal domain-containing protein [Elusimicrobia bacterium]|nr:ParB N-terminal domain-containing protein [Elusimicrobiota bacterium]
MSYTISAISQESPDMPDSEWADFVADIKAHGQLVPIVVMHGEVIDGRKRVRACQELGIEPRVTELGALEPVEAARSLNILRTHYTVGQRGVFAAQRATLSRGQAATRNGKPWMAKSGHPGSRPITADQAAREVGVARGVVRDAQRILRGGVPELVQAVKDGKLSLHKAKRIASEVPIERQPEATRAAIGQRRRAPIGPALGKKALRKWRRTPMEQQIKAMADQIGYAVAHLETLTGDGPVSISEQCIELLRDGRSRLSTVIHNLEANREA